MGANTTASENTSVGYQSMYTNTTGGQNVAVGTYALYPQTTGANNTAVGYNAGGGLTTGSNNVIVGQRAGQAITTASFNTTVGRIAATALTEGQRNTALGYAALQTDTKGSRNVALGFNALGGQNFTSATDSYNVAIGYDAGGSLSTGDQCTLVGGLVGDALTNNNQITMLGYNLAASSSSGTSREIVIGSNGTGGGSNTVRFATSVGIATLNIDGSDTSWAAASDLRLKKDVEDSTVGLSFINDLRPITLKWNNKNAIADSLPQYDSESSDPVFGEGKAHHGFIAQEVKTVIDSHSDVVNGHNIWAEDPDGTQQVAPSALIPMLVKAIQELSAKNDALEARIATLEG